MRKITLEIPQNIGKLNSDVTEAKKKSKTKEEKLESIMRKTKVRSVHAVMD